MRMKQTIDTSVYFEAARGYIAWLEIPTVDPVRLIVDHRLSDYLNGAAHHADDPSAPSVERLKGPAVEALHNEVFRGLSDGELHAVMGKLDLQPRDYVDGAQERAATSLRVTNRLADLVRATCQRADGAASPATPTIVSL